MPIKTRQKMMRPTMEVPGPGPTSDWARVAMMMRMSSSPYIFLRPTMSARAPKPTWPMTVPAEVDSLMAVSWVVSSTPLLSCL